MKNDYAYELFCFEAASFEAVDLSTECSCIYLSTECSCIYLSTECSGIYLSTERSGIVSWDLSVAPSRCV